MSTISQWAVYQMCQTLDNNYSYILKIVKDVYPELYSESPTYDWERKSILGYFHKKFSELFDELSREALEEEKQKPFQWSNWKESTNKEILIIDLTHRIPTNWKIYRLYQKNEGNCLDILDILKKKYPNFAIPDDCTDDHLSNEMRQIYEKVQTIIDGGCKEEIKEQKDILFTWKSKKIESTSPLQGPSAELKESCSNFPTNWDIYKLCLQERSQYKSILKLLQKEHPDLYIHSNISESQCQRRLKMIYRKISLLIKNEQMNEIDEEKKTPFTWCIKDSNHKETKPPSAELKESCSNFPTNWDIYKLCQQKKFQYKSILKLLQKEHPDLYIHSNISESQRQRRLQMIYRKISLLVRNKQMNEVDKEKKTPFTWCIKDSNHKETKPPSAELKESCSNFPTNWDIYKLCLQERSQYKSVLKLLQKEHPDLYIHSNISESQCQRRLQMIYRKISLLVRNKQMNEVDKEKKTPFTWCIKDSNHKETKPPSAELKESCSNFPTNWDIYKLCLQKKFQYKSIWKLLQKEHPDLYIHSNISESQCQRRLKMIYRKISLLVRNKQMNEVDKEKKTPFTWCIKDSNHKETKPFSADVDLKKIKASVREEIIHEDSSKASIDSIPVDDLFSSSASPPPSPNVNCTFILPVSQPQSPIRAAAAAATPSPNQDLPNDSEDKDLILAIKKFETLINGTSAEIAAKDAKIENLRKEINNVLKTQKKVSSNLKRLKFQQLSQKIST